MRRLHPWVAIRIVTALILLQGLTVVSVVHHPPRDLRVLAAVGVILAMLALSTLLHRWAWGELPQGSAPRSRRLLTRVRRGPAQPTPRG
jgi:hypothetical protein